MHCVFVLLLGHGCEDLLHLVDDAVQLVWVFFYNLLDGVTHWWLDIQKQSQQHIYKSNVIPWTWSMVSICMHLADGEGVPVQLLREHESLSEHSFVVVGVLDDGRGGGMTKHRAHVTFKWLNNCCDHLLIAVEKKQTLDFFFSDILLQRCCSI